MASFWKRWWGKHPTADEQYKQELHRLREKAPIPVIWLFGKTGSGKSSVIQYLTGAEAATIGEGYRPETKTLQRFDFPSSTEPLLTFLDTRGLGEATYDPREDIERFAHLTQLMVATVRVDDHALDNVIKPLRHIRRTAPERPILLVLTCLHHATGLIDVSAGEDPFTTASVPIAQTKSLPGELQLQINEKLKQFSGLYDSVIPIDLTKLEDGFANPNFGGDRLKQAILDYLPQAYRQALLTLHDTDRPPMPYRQRKARWQVLASSALAATAGAVPLPWVDIPAVLGVQTHLAVKIAGIYGQEITPAQWVVLSSAAGSRIVLRMAIREALKFIPLVGIAAGAASSFAFTYALGMSWDWYFAEQCGGNVPSPEQLKEVFAEQLKRGHELWRAT